MGGNIHTLFIQQGINIQNIQEIQQYKKNPNNLKVGKEHEQIFLKRKHTNGYQVYEAMLNITNQINTNQNHNEILPYPSENGYELTEQKGVSQKASFQF